MRIIISIKIMQRKKHKLLSTEFMKANLFYCNIENSNNNDKKIIYL